MRKTTFVVWSVPAIAMLLVWTLPDPAAAADADPSKCFQQMLVNHYDFSQRENLLLAALAIVDKDTYKESLKNVSLHAALEDIGLLKENFEDYDKERTHFFQYNSLNVNQYAETLINSTWISDRGYQTIDKCLDDIFDFDRDGFHYKVEIASPEQVAIQFRWSDPHHGQGYVKILDSKIVNGNVDEAPRHKLFSPRTPMTVGKASVPIFITRESVDKDIFITLTTDLDRQPGVIRIDHPIPEKPLMWKQFVRETDPAGNVIAHSDSREIKNDNWELVLRPLEGYQFAEMPSCEQDTHYPLSNVYILNKDWNTETNTFVCKGTQNANPRFIVLKWTQGKSVERCVMHCGLQKTEKELAAKDAQQR